MYEVHLTPEALRVYRRAQSSLAKKLSRCFDNLSHTPCSHPNIKRLSGRYAGCWRYRVGDWRVIYYIDEDRRKVVVVNIVHRREAYR
jgi:mRNA interferase RelE/StbE